MHGAAPDGTSQLLSPPATSRGGRTALAILLSINMFNYVDRYVLAAVEPAVQKDFFKPADPNAEAWMGSLATAFIFSYLLLTHRYLVGWRTGCRGGCWWE